MIKKKKGSMKWEGGIGDYIWLHGQGRHSLAYTKMPKWSIILIKENK
jgi:hypothetical protein